MLLKHGHQKDISLVHIRQFLRSWGVKGKQQDCPLIMFARKAQERLQKEIQRSVKITEQPLENSLENPLKDSLESRIFYFTIRMAVKICKKGSGEILIMINEI